MKTLDIIIWSSQNNTNVVKVLEILDDNTYVMECLNIVCTWLLLLAYLLLQNQILMVLMIG